MPRYLLDTSALLAHSRREEGWERVRALFDDGDAEILVASVTLTEMARRLRELCLRRFPRPQRSQPSVAV